MFKILSVYFVISLLLYSVISEDNANLPKIVNETTSDINKEISPINDLARTKPLNLTNNITTTHHGREGVDPALYTEGGQIQGLTKVEEGNKLVPVSSTNHSLALDISAEHVVPKSSVHRRKGAPVYTPADNDPISHETVSVESSKMLTPTVSNATVNISNSSKPDVPLNVNNSVSQKLLPKSTTTPTTVKPLPKKPVITVPSEDVFPPLNIIPLSKTTITSTTTKVTTPPISTVKLNNTEKSTTPVIIPVLEESIDSSVNKEKQFREYFNPVPKKQPGFIIPIVITLLAVPMLGLIGYQAIRRGREAWRNRHYRRMDFLIDGMYND